MGCCCSSTRFGGAAGAFPGARTSEEADWQKALTSHRDEPADDDAAAAAHDEHEQTMAFLAKVPLFKRLAMEERHLLALNCDQVNFKDGDIVIEQGADGDAFFLITQGEAVVSVGFGKDAKNVATLHTGDYVGETALLENSRRTATVTASNGLSCLRLSQERFKELKLHRKLKFAKRKAVGGGEVECRTQPPSVKTPAERELMAKALRANANLEAVVRWSDELVTNIIDIAWKEDVKKDACLINHGDIEAHHFYIINHGSFEFQIPMASKDDQSPDAPKKLCPVGSVQTGASFGELALMYNHPRAATAKALEDSVVWVIDRNSFKQMLVKGSDSTQAYVKCLNKIAIFDALLQREKESVAQALTELAVKKGDVLMKQGDPGDKLYILHEGTVDISKDGKNIASLKSAIGSMDDSHIIGEQALLSDAPRGATATVASDAASLLVLERSDFEQLLGSLSDIMKESAEDRAAHAANGKDNRKTAGAGGFDPSHAIPYERLVKKGLLGCGAFGVVELVKDSNAEDFYALKGLNKGWIVQSGMQKRTQSERDILMMLDSPFVVKLFSCYNLDQTLFFLLELAQGGELFEVYEKLSLSGSPPHAKYYSASVSCAFEHLHMRKIIYRDLKPENLLLDKDGHLKVTDMGLAKFTFGKTYSTCGTPEYFAPEVVQSTGHTVAADWWALGILIYEMLDGSSPFADDSTAKMYKKIVKGVPSLKWRGVWKEKKNILTKDLITQLLQEDAKQRLPMKIGGCKNLQTHAWYTDTNFEWDGLRSGKLMAPYKPPNTGKGKVTNFAATEADKPPTVKYEDDGTGWDAGFAT